MGALRHADIRETLIYALFSPDEGRAAMVNLDDDTPTATDTKCHWLTPPPFGPDHAAPRSALPRGSQPRDRQRSKS